MIKIAEGKYIDLTSIKNELEYYEALANQLLTINESYILTSTPSSIGSLYVDETTLNSYYVDCKDNEKTKVKQLKLNQKMICGIEH